jgi:hypothetical protein
MTNLQKYTRILIILVRCFNSKVMGRNNWRRKYKDMRRLLIRWLLCWGGRRIRYGSKVKRFLGLIRLFWNLGRSLEGNNEITIINLLYIFISLYI